MQKLICSLWMALVALTQVTAEEEPSYVVFHKACEKGDVDAVRDFLRKEPGLIDSIDDDGATCLLQSAVTNKLELVKLLVEAGAYLNDRPGGEHHNMPVIAWHILAGNHEIVDYLITQGAEINTPFEGIDREGEPVGTFLALDLVDFMLEHINPKHEEEIKSREIIRDHLVLNGARKFVGSEEF